jgi:hypothetical protein
MTTHIVNNDQVAHLFAHQSQDWARNQSGSFYFEGDTCWSYGSHFVAAVHHGDCVLINAETYSPTTGKQLSALRHACSHLEAYTVDYPNASTKDAHRENFRAMVEEYERLILKAGRARKYADTWLSCADTLLYSANRYAARFKIGNRLKPVKPANVEQIKERAAKQAKAERARKAAERKKMLAEFNEKAPLWRAGAGPYALPYRWDLPPILRVNGDTVETSHGASFPVTDAPAAIAMVRACVEHKRDWERNGEQVRLGSFRLDKINADGTVKAGCHTVAYKEVEYIATQLGV